MSIGLRKVWRDLWRNKGRTLLVVASIAVGVLAVGMITSSNRLMVRQMGRAQVASQPSHVNLFLTGLVDDEMVAVIRRLPEVADAEGLVNLSIRWKAHPDDEWETANLVALNDYEHQKFDLVMLRNGSWPDSGGC